MISGSPAYLELARTGELEHRAKMLNERLTSCDLCPRDCRINRIAGQAGFCQSGALAEVASSCDHHGEEPAISGTRGSGTIFFAHCTLRCIFCQNHQISQPVEGAAFPQVDAAALAGRMLSLQAQGCHNINLVSPTQYVPQIVEALAIAARNGLRVPIVYNTNGYESLATLATLAGIVDVYLPDLKYADESCAIRYSQGKGYVASTRDAIREMYRQTGELVMDGEGLAVRGLIVRHLVMPNGASGSCQTIAWLAAEVAREVTVSLMAQYYPANKAARVPRLCRRITAEEYGEAVQELERQGMENGWIQEPDASDYYVPDFAREGHPFQAL